MVPVPRPTSATPTAGRHVLVVDRFDRTPAGARLGNDSATVALALSVAPVFRLSAADARRTLGEVAAAVSDWRRVAEQWLAPREVERIAPAFAELDAVPARCSAVAVRTGCGPHPDRNAVTCGNDPIQ